VDSLLHGLLKDLLQRCHRLKQELTSLVSLPMEVSPYKEWVLNFVQVTEKRIEYLLEDPDIRDRGLAKNYYHAYKRLSEIVWRLEWRPILALTRYSERDRLATLICHQIAEEINFPYDRPICMALSSQHYWADPASRLIVIPSVEPFHLLGLSDMYHEIGHIILFQQKEVEAETIDLVDQHFNQAIKHLKQEGESDTFQKELAYYMELWKRYWAREFACDMIATYLAGPAYGWANVRLCANVSTDIYGDDPSDPYYTHPADAARSRAIEMMLKQLGFEQMAQKIKDLWNQLIALIGQTEPQEFEFRFPLSLIEKLCGTLKRSCQNLQLISYSEKASEGGGHLHMTQLLNKAWNNFISDTENFAEWENTQISRIKATFGLQ
jgi:hypothetical protein